MNNIAAVFNEAIAALNNRNFERAEEKCRQVLNSYPSHVPALNLLTVVLMSMGRFADAEPIVAHAVTLNGNSDVSFYNYGLIAKLLSKPQLAVEQFSNALKLNPNVPETWNNRGTARNDLREYESAISDFNRAIDLNRNYADAYANKGKSLLQLKRYDEAFAAFDKALLLKPDLPGVEGSRLESKALICNWENITDEIAHLSASVRGGKPISLPFTLLYLTESPEDQLLCARTWAAANHPPSTKPIWQGEIHHRDKIRIGYVSADFHKHATAFLMAEAFELHDRNKFHIAALSLGPDDKSDMRQRLMRSFDEFIDCRSLSDLEIARKVFDAGIDILVDLKGFTEDSHTNIFAQRAAPVQVNYLGYPGTMGAPYIDYIIGDTTLFDLSDEKAYSEKLVRLPHSYQPNDRKRQIAKTMPTRKECGLPDDGFVFCCFNNNYKILPAMFDSWMSILGRSDRSVLWLLECNPAAAENLRREAATRGINPERLVFAKRAELPEHLARHRQADLFLDGLPYNAHTTASDALWAGLPVLTQIGKTLPGRVAASLLNAVGLPELITHSREEYEALATELALDRERLLNLKEKLDRNRLTAPLFDAALFTRHLEAAYEAMYRRYQAGLPPDHIAILPMATSTAALASSL
ncbi:MAG: tetratricopeptide repeat protein [Pseudomonadota bacterium]